MSYSWGVGRGPVDADGHSAAQPVRPGGPLPERLDNVRSITPDPAGARGADLQLLAAELAPMVDVWKRLLVQHVPDRAGRCRTCTKGGTGLPSVAWPCSVHGIAELARRCHTGEAC